MSLFHVYWAVVPRRSRACWSVCASAIWPSWRHGATGPYRQCAHLRQLRAEWQERTDRGQREINLPDSPDGTRTDTFEFGHRCASPSTPLHQRGEGSLRFSIPLSAKRRAGRGWG